MPLQQALAEVLDTLPDERVREVLDFARFLAQANEQEEWRTFGRKQLARAYGDGEPEYSEADLLPRSKP